MGLEAKQSWGPSAFDTGYLHAARPGAVIAERIIDSLAELTESEVVPSH